MSKSKLNTISKYTIKKVIKVLSLKENGFVPDRYELWDVKGPNGFKKLFVTKKDAQAYIKELTRTTMNGVEFGNLLKEIKYA